MMTTRHCWGTFSSQRPAHVFEKAPEIAELYGGELRLATSQLGGLRAELLLPAATE